MQWYHQHFATGPKPAKFIRLGSNPGNEKYRVTTRLLSGGEGDMILSRDEDPYIRQLFEKEVAQKGAKMVMPPHAELIAMEKDGRLPAIY